MLHKLGFTRKELIELSFSKTELEFVAYIKNSRLMADELNENNLSSESGGE